MYFVLIILKSEDDVINKYYIVDEGKLALLSHLDMNDYGDCCGQSRCIACKLEGYKASFGNYVEIDNFDILSKIITDDFLKLNELVSWVVNNQAEEILEDITCNNFTDIVYLFDAFCKAKKENYLKMIIDSLNMIIKEEECKDWQIDILSKIIFTSYDIKLIKKCPSSKKYLLNLRKIVD